MSAYQLFLTLPVIRHILKQLKDNLISPQKEEHLFLGLGYLTLFFYKEKR